MACAHKTIAMFVMATSDQWFGRSIRWLPIDGMPIVSALGRYTVCQEYPTL
jgi:hypothetical protein